MSDSINELAQAGRSANALSAIANPGQLNVLGAYAGAAQTARSIYGVQQLQAEKAWGQALQAATGPDGTVDFPKAQAIAAQTPLAAMGMQTALRNTSALQTEQVVRAGATLATYGSAAMSVWNDPSDQNVNAAFDNLKGIWPAEKLEAERQRVLAMPQADRQRYAVQHGLSAMDAMQRWGQTVGGQGIMHMPQGDIPYTQDPTWRGGTVHPAPGGAKAGLPPAQPVVPDTRPGAAPNTYTPVVPPGGGGTQNIPIPPIPPAGGDGSASPAAFPPGYNGRAPIPALANPAKVASPPAPNAAPPAGTSPPAPSPTTPQPTYTQAPQGQPDLLQKDIDARTAANVAMPTQQKRLIAGQTALEALNLAGDSTGPATGWFARAYAFLQTQTGNAPSQGSLSQTEYRQILVKNLLRFAQNSGTTAGTDLGLETQLHSNANADEMLAGANRHVLVQDLGILKRDIAQTREMPAASGTGDVVKHIGSFSDKTAPEAFMWNEYSQQERDAIEAKYAKDGQSDKLHRSLELAVRRGMIPDPRKAAPAPAPAAPAAPPASRAPVYVPGMPSRPLAMAQPNALAAYA